jgi:hypothetical protein
MHLDEFIDVVADERSQEQPVGFDQHPPSG